MRYIDLQAAFELEINKIDSNLEKPKSIDTQYWLNQGLELFYKTRYSGNNNSFKGFEGNQKRTDDLRSLIRTKVFELDEDTWYLNQQNGGHNVITPDYFVNLEEIPIDKIHTMSHNCFYIRVPKNYMFLLGDKVSIIPTDEEQLKCAKRDQYGEIIPYTDDSLESTIETFDAQLKNSLSEHRFKYGKARPLRLMQDNVIGLFTDGNYMITKYQIFYLKRPNKIDIHKDPLEEYTDMPSHTHSEIVKLAVKCYLENTTNSRYNSYQNEIIQME